MNTTTATRRWSGAASALAATLGLGLILLVTLIIDQIAVHSLADHVDALYSPHGLTADHGFLFVYLYLTLALALALWLLAYRGVRGHKRWARPVTVIVLLVTGGIVFLNLFANEYDIRILPTFWGVLNVLPWIAGLIGALLLFTRDGNRGPA